MQFLKRKRDSHCNGFQGQSLNKQAAFVFFKFKINNVDMVGSDHHSLPKVSEKNTTHLSDGDRLPNNR